MSGNRVTPLPQICQDPSGRATCKKCKVKIGKGELRITSFKPSAHHDGFDAQHRHARCAADVGTLDEQTVLVLPWRDQVQYSTNEAQKTALETNEKAQRSNDIFIRCLDHLEKVCRPIDVKALVEANGYARTVGCKAIPGHDLALMAADGLSFGRLGVCPVCSSRALRHAGHDQGPYSMTWCDGFFNMSKCTYTNRGMPVRDAPSWIVPPSLRKGAAKKGMADLADASDSKLGGAPPDVEEPTPRTKKRKKDEAEGDGTVDVPGLVKVPESSQLRRVDLVAMQEVPGASIYVSHGGFTAWNVQLIAVDAASHVNSFYRLQLLRLGSSFAIFAKWGRVGDDEKEIQYRRDDPSRSTKAMVHPHSTLHDAREEFCAKFLEKTNNSWLQYAKHRFFKQKPGFFNLLPHADHEPPLQQEMPTVPKATTPKKPPATIILEPQVAEFVSQIFSQSVAQAHLAHCKIDTAKFPLGALAPSTIATAYRALSTAAEALANRSGDWQRWEAVIQDATNTFLAAIPHVQTRSSQHRLRLSSMDIIREKTDLVKTLSDILAGLQLDRTTPEVSSVATHYASLECDVTVLLRSSERSQIEAYVKRGLPRAVVKTVFQLRRHNELSSIGGVHQLLFHGSPLPNWAGILSQGLRIAPPEAPASGYNFDKGIYFADTACKAATYCRSVPGTESCLLLADVATGDPLVMTDINPQANQARIYAKKDSVLGLGTTVPDSSLGFGQTPSQAYFSLGHPITSPIPSALSYNEYVVYDPARVRFEYLLLLSTTGL